MQNLISNYFSQMFYRQKFQNQVGIEMRYGYETMCNQGYQVVPGEEKNPSSGLISSNHDILGTKKI